MKIRVEFTIQATHDLREASFWYREQAQLDEAFKNSVEAAIKRVSEYPQMCPVKYRDVRRALVHNFPYLIMYRIEEGRIIVIAIVHFARR